MTRGTGPVRSGPASTPGSRRRPRSGSLSNSKIRRFPQTPARSPTGLGDPFECFKSLQRRRIDLFSRGFEGTGRFEEGSSEFPRRPERETPRKFVPGRSNRRYPASIGIPRRRTPCGASSRAGRISTGGTRRSARRTASPRRRSSGARRVSAYPETRALSRVSFPVVEASTVPRSGTKDVDGRVSSGTCARAIISRGASSTGDGRRTARRSGSGGG